ncbi:MAG TPA: lipoprotein [Burkholderiaceae bacterium]|nr:lipoprotein [Burkholderiaceae bacterium]
MKQANAAMKTPATGQAPATGRPRSAPPRLALLALSASALLAGCGMRGPLYLPERPAPEKQRPAESQVPRTFAPSLFHARLS